MYLLLFIVIVTCEVAIPWAHSFQNVSSHLPGGQMYLQTFDFFDKFLPKRLLGPLWKYAYHVYSNIINKMQRYTMVFITINALHVSGGSSTHHQELKTLYTASGICRAFSASYRYREWFGSSNRNRKSSTNIRCCVHSFELLMMDGGTAWNM